MLLFHSLENFAGKKRVSVYKDGITIGQGPILYWMSRDMRIKDNWALATALHLASELDRECVIAFLLEKKVSKSDQRKSAFMCEGLLSVISDARKLGISFAVIDGDSAESIGHFANTHDIPIMVCDYSPLKDAKKKKSEASSLYKGGMLDVDAHNIVPVWLASSKKEYSARTIRPKIKKMFPEFSTLPILHVKRKSNRIWGDIKSIKALASIKTNYPPSGERQAMKKLKDFIDNKLNKYSKLRNDPSQDFQSGLSPFIHFGQIYVGRILHEMGEIGGLNKESFFDELVIRRELAENFCHYEPNYDNHLGAPDWGKKTLNKHESDDRLYVYSMTQFRNAKTHDPVWNACEAEMMITGKMHGYMRMYWAKKILEWSKSPSEALRIAISLNDEYELDGKDPNGYANIMWAIYGLHDRPWPERSIYGTIRSMSADGLKRKFDIEKYVARVQALEASDVHTKDNE